MLQHAFLIQAHTFPLLLARFISKLNAPNHHFFINIDAKVDPEHFEKARIVLNCILTKIPIPYRKSIKGVRAGWVWFSWHRNVVTFVVNYFIENPNFLKRFKHTSCCDEIIFHTLLYPYLDELNICKEDSKRFIEWHPKRQYTGRLPLILNESEYREIIESGVVFCRKVEPDISNILMDLLDKR